jgi:GntR family transcriptional regulator / MocR family aminotransferase
MQLPVHIDETSPVPLRAQLCDQIRAMIVDGLLAPGSEVPSTRELSTQLHIARNTVVRAYEKLIAEGYLEARSATATFVSQVLPHCCTGVEADLETAPPPYPPSGSAGVPPSPPPFPPPLAGEGQGGGGLDARAPRREGGEGALPVPADFSDMRLELFSPASQRLRYDFRVGRPDAALFPRAAWQRLVIECLGGSQQALTDYGDPAGHWPLRDAIATHLRHARGIRTRPEEIIIVAGSQEGLNLAGRLLNVANATVAIEDPCYQGADFAFRSLGAAMRPVRVDAEGIDVSALGGEPAALAYVTPSHQFPLGVTMSVERRRQLLDWADRTGAYILEDDYDSDFRYHSSPLLALKALDRHHRVIYLGTFSKSIGPGLRLGYVVAPAHLGEPARRLKALMNNGHPWLDQAVVAEFVASGAFANHLVRIRKRYMLRRDRLIHELNRLLGPVRLEGIDGGMHLTCHLPDNLADAHALQQLMKRAGVGIYSLAEGPATCGNRFCGDDRIVMFGYPCVPEADISEAMRRFGQVLARGPRPRARPAADTVLLRR